MPLKKKRNRGKISVLAGIALIAALALLYFSPTIHTTEIVLFP